MSAPGLLDRLKNLRARAAEAGWRETLRKAALTRLLRPEETLPLGRVDPVGLLTDGVDEIHEREKMQIRATSLMFDASNVEATYPEVLEHEGRYLRYALLPARGESKGLVVLFHGHNAFLHMGPMSPWRDFDLLAPWDTFGFKRQGSWFWGEKGKPTTEAAIRALIDKVRAQNPDKPWFCTGGSMGGFGALWHGIKGGCDGIYVMCPQVDLKRKTTDYDGDERENPYEFLADAEGNGLPDLLALAGGQDDLPPLYLVQNLYDHVNPFATHAKRLIDVYDAKRGWYGLRIHPSVGHGGDGKQEEAELFFRRILERAPGRRFGG